MVVLIFHNDEIIFLKLLFSWGIIHLTKIVMQVLEKERILLNYVKMLLKVRKAIMRMLNMLICMVMTLRVV